MARITLNGRTRGRHAGFTLIELMIVIAIIAILSSIAISVYQDATAKAELSEAFTVGDGLKTPVADYRHQTVACPAQGHRRYPRPGQLQRQIRRQRHGDRPAPTPCTITTLMRNNTVARAASRQARRADHDSRMAAPRNGNAPATYRSSSCRKPAAETARASPCIHARNSSHPA